MQPVKYLQELQVKTETDAINSGQPTLSLIRREKGEPVAMAVMVKLIVNLVGFFNVGKQMNDQQCAETCELILKEYHYLNIADFRLCFDRIKAGTYGQLYDRIDGQIIILALAEYTRGRVEVSQNLNEQKIKEEAKEREELEGKDCYIIKTDGGYVREDSKKEYSEVPQKEMATKFSYGDAVVIKNWLNKEKYSAHLIWFYRSDIGLIEWAKENSPDLVDQSRRRNDRVRVIKAKIEEIEQMDISLYEKNCLTRDALDLERLTLEEFIQREKEILGIDEN